MAILCEGHEEGSTQLVNAVFFHARKLAFTRYCHYQYCMLNGKNKGGGRKPYIAQY